MPDPDRVSFTITLRALVRSIGVAIDTVDLFRDVRAEGIDPQLGRLAFDLGNLASATGWVALGSFAIATGPC